MTVLALIASACGSGADEQQEPAPLFDSLLTAEYGWAHSIGGDGADEGREIAVDSDGNVYITGRFTGVVDFDPDPSVDVELTSNDAFLVDDPDDHQIADELRCRRHWLAGDSGDARRITAHAAVVEG